MVTPPTVLVVSAADWIAPPQVARILERTGARVSTLAPPKSKLGTVRVGGTRFFGPEDAGATLEQLRLHLAEGRSYRWVVFGDDLLLAAAMIRADEPWLAEILPCAGGRRAAAALVSKTAFSQAMHAAGVPMPDASSVSGPDELTSAAARVGFPVIVKPDCGYAGLGVFAAADDAELRARAGKTRGACLVERQIAGRLGGTAVLFDRGRLAWWSSFFKTGVMPKPFGPSCRRQLCDLPGAEIILGKIGGALGLHGLCGVDWILGDNGSVTVIELNGRPIPIDEENLHTRPALTEALRDFLAGNFSVRPPAPVAADDDTWHLLPKSFHLAVAEHDYLLAARLAAGVGGRTFPSCTEPEVISSNIEHLWQIARRQFPRR